MRDSFLVFLLLLLSNSLAASFLNGGSMCYDPRVKTIQVFRQGDELEPPVIRLNSDERIVFRFDDMSQELRRFRFTVIHCGTDWEPSAGLIPSDYLQGYREENIDTYTYSYNTTIPYIHYEGVFPTGTMGPAVSGNYLLVVYDDEPSQQVFTARFMVTEPSPVAVIAQVVQPDGGLTVGKQRIDLVVKLNGLEVLDVDREIKVIVSQNGRIDNEIARSRPRFVRTGELDYRYDDSLSFDGGNQFRNFDMRSLKYPTERIARMEFDTAWQVYLQADIPRTYRQYVREKDLYGGFVVSYEDYPEKSATEADYAWVHFFVPFPTLITDATFHIMGEFTSWQADESNRLYYNPSHKGYEATLLLKQGFYNYLYGVKKKGSNRLDMGMLEGNHWETDNEYTIRVYYRPAGSLYDRLVSWSVINPGR